MTDAINPHGPNNPSCNTPSEANLPSAGSSTPLRTFSAESTCQALARQPHAETHSSASTTRKPPAATLPGRFSSGRKEEMEGVCHMSAMTGSYLTWHEKYRIGHTESGQIGQTEPNRLNRTKSGRIGRKRGNRGRFARARWDGFSRSAGQTGGQPINQSANQTENHSTSDRASMM